MYILFPALSLFEKIFIVVGTAVGGYLIMAAIIIGLAIYATEKMK